MFNKKLKIYSSVKSSCCIFWLDHTRSKSQEKPSYLPSTTAHFSLSCQPQRFHHFLLAIHSSPWILRIIYLNSIPLLLITLSMYVHVIFYSHRRLDRTSGPLSATLSLYHIPSSFLRSLALHTVSHALTFLFHITPNPLPLFLHKLLADSISSNVVYKKGISFSKTIYVSDTSGSIMIHQSQQRNYLFWTEAKIVNRIF